MSEQNPTSSADEFESSLKVPAHPFFDAHSPQPSFIDCVDAIDHVKAMIDLCNTLELENEVGAGLTSSAVSGFFWVSFLSRETLDYSSDRLMELYRQHCAENEKAQAQLSALLLSLPTLGKSNRERYLNSVAAHMELNRSELDQFIKKQTEQ